MKRVTVLGGGMVGSAIAMDLARGAFAVTVVDRSADVLGEIVLRCGVKTRQGDLSDAHALTEITREADVVVGALPGALGFCALSAMIEAKKDYVDISFMPEDPSVLSERAKELGVRCVFDCGVAPGFSNMLAAKAARSLSTCRSLDIMVGGLPAVRRWPFEYKAGFSPIDVLEEYTRPARVVEHGQIVTREALSNIERVDFEGVGTLEAFDTDGLRSLAHTLNVPFMRERTLRYPGHAELMRVFRETGLFSSDAIDIDGHSVRPIDVTARLVFPKWRFAKGEADFTVMRVVAEGECDGKPARHTWELFDRLDETTALRSMSRTTGFTASSVTRLLASDALGLGPGVHPPEALAEDGFLCVLEDLRAHGVRVEETRA